MTRERQRLRILYEDRLGAVPDFPLHRLVLAAAADRCTLEPWRLAQRVISIPKKGRDRVFEEVGRTPLHVNDGVCVLAWLDDDHVRDTLPNPSRLTRTEVIAHIKARAGNVGPGRIEVLLLDKNLESLLEAIERELVGVLGSELVHKAIAKKRVDSRDLCLLKVAHTPELRQLLCQRHPGFDCVVRYVAEIATVEPWPFHGR